MSRIAAISKLLAAAAAGLFLATACSSYWSQQVDGEPVVIDLDAGASVVWDVELDLVRTTDDPLPCRALAWSLSATFDGDQGSLVYQVLRLGLGEELATGSVEDADDVHLLTSDFDDNDADHCRTALQVVWTATEATTSEVTLHLVATDTSAGPDDEPGPTELSLTLEESVDEPAG